jgi:glucose/arabinose dehydrogenase
MCLLVKILLITLASTASLIRFAVAQVYPPDFAQQLVANGLANPTAIAFAPDGRIFVAEQAGKLRVVKNNALLPTSFVQLTVNSTGERGLLGIAIDPDFATNNFIYLYYTVPGTPAHNRVSRFTANGDVAQPGSESVVLELDALTAATNHNGGAMHFGKDGKLYIAVGENATTANSQNLNTYHGKLLRINKDGSVPQGNPFPTGSEQAKRVWAYGLRNPYTLSIHPASGKIFVNDVGQSLWEEINDATTGGRNFGWPATEGNFDPATFPNFTNPVYAYPQGSGDGKGCAITGGAFFYPEVTNYPSAYFDRYFFQDHCNRWINDLELSGSQAARFPFATGIQGASLALNVGTDGNLYYLSRSAQALYRIIYNKTTTPYITNQPASATVAQGEPVSFAVSALGTTPFSFQWQKDGENIAGATNGSFSLSSAEPKDSGQYRVIVSNAAGNTASNAASLSVIMNSVPTAEIISPTSESTYVAGTTFSFSGSGTDLEDGPLPASSFSWQIDFHHDSHKHDQPAIAGITNGKFDIPNEGETSANVFYRLILSVVDSDGSIGKDTVNVYPEKSTIRFTTDPPALQVTVDGQPFTTPFDVVSVEGVLRSIGTISPQLINNVPHEFEAWSNGGTLIQTLITPAEDMELKATFSTVVGAEESQVTEPQITLYPNPAQGGYVTISISSRQRQHVTIQLADMVSREVEQVDQEIQSGRHDYPFYFGKKRNGFYYLTVPLKEGTVVKKLAVID